MTSSSPHAPEPLYGGSPSGRRVSVTDLSDAKRRGEKWPMITAYDALTARVFDEAGIPVLLVGDSAAMVVYGYDSTIPVTVDDMLPLTGAVVRGSTRAMVVADLPFASYQSSPAQALETSARFMKEAGAHAVKLEGGARVLPQVELLASSGVPVMAHLGLTPQSVHSFGGYKVQGRGDEAVDHPDQARVQHGGQRALRAVQVGRKLMRAGHGPPRHPADQVARAYLASVEGTVTGQVIDPRKQAGK